MMEVASASLVTCGVFQALILLGAKLASDNVAPWRGDSSPMHPAPRTHLTAQGALLAEWSQGS